VCSSDLNAAKRGEPADPLPGLWAKQRSLHNNYLTLPVLFIMISSHYPMTYGNSQGWLLLAGIALVGILVRHFFNMKNQGKAKQGFILLPIAFVLFLIIAYASSPKTDLAEMEPVPFATVERIIEERCASCHAANPSSKDFDSPPKGVKLETAAQIAPDRQ